VPIYLTNSKSSRHSRKGEEREERGNPWPTSGVTLRAFLNLFGLQVLYLLKEESIPTLPYHPTIKLRNAQNYLV
jgi:hypothetical protein